MIAVAAWIAKQERERISERVKAGMERARKAGKVCGKPRVILDRAKVKALHAQGLGSRAIAKKLGGCSHMTVSRILAA